MAPETTTAPNDYSCYIHIHNETSVDFGLFDSSVEYGHWAPGSPANTIEANSEAEIILKDNKGTSGSQGKVAYELYLPKNPEKKITFGVEFCDPYGLWYDNFCHVNTPFPTVLSCKVLPYSGNGHPFTAHVYIYAVGGTNLNSIEGQKLIAEAVPTECMSIPNDTYEAKYDMGFNFPGLVDKKPVHESITIAALISSNIHLAKGATYNNLNKDQWEYIRGVLWNDDPSALLFDDSQDNNRDFGVGAEWYDAFKFGPDGCLTRRSHFGNLQFLHSMATGNAEDPQKTKDSLIVWLEVMYKLACGNQGVSVGDRLDDKLSNNFSGSTNPSGSGTLKDLLLGTTRKYKWPKFDRRALGVCLHIISDSYAVGHTLRRLLNPQDMDGRDKEGFVRFRSGTYANLGPVITFHTYAGQDSDRHGHYDQYKGDAESLVPKSLDTFNGIIGARDAIEKCTKFLNFYQAKTKWEDGVRDFLYNIVFELDKEATPSNAQVDAQFGVSTIATVSAATQDRFEDLEYRAGMESKFAMLETGLAHTQRPSGERSSGGIGRWIQGAGGRLVTVLRCVLLFVAFFIMFALSTYLMRVLKLA